MNHPTRPLVGMIVVAALSLGGTTRPGMIVQPVSMFLSDDRLYVSDASEGIVVYEALPGQAPAYRATIPLRGNTGVAVQGDVIYASSWGSIYAFRLLADGRVDTLAVVFDDPYDSPGIWDESGGSYGWGCGDGCGSDYNLAPAASSGSSYAVFAVIDTFLYHVDRSRSALVTLSIADPSAPRLLGLTHPGWDPETLFPTEDYLFVGTTSGMFIMDRNDPASPTLIGGFSHARACDPVVVQGNVAYVTLRGDGGCGAVEDALLAVDIQDPSAPETLCTRSPATPYGLTVQEDWLYLANGWKGFSLYSTARPDSLTKVMSWTSPVSRDFIWSGATLYLLGFENLTTYDVSDPWLPRKLGSTG